MNDDFHKFKEFDYYYNNIIKFLKSTEIEEFKKIYSEVSENKLKEYLERYYNLIKTCDSSKIKNIDEYMNVIYGDSILNIFDFVDGNPLNKNCLACLNVGIESEFCIACVDCKRCKCCVGCKDCYGCNYMVDGYNEIYV